MKRPLSFTPALLALAALGGSLLPLHGASFTEAQFTRLENEVKVLKQNAPPHAAAVGENVKAVTSVATGVNSRAELRFPDKSLTRLGANSRFTIRGEQRTLDLDQGVMMLQVPKKMGGAKVRTAAVTAAVTGTTAFFEYLPNGYVKLIVIEGVVDLYSNKDPSHFQEVHAGQMIIMDPNSTNIPPPVDVDLKRLLHTSRLLSQFENLPNTAYVNDAVQQQQNEINHGNLLETNLVIPGLGTIVSITDNTAHNLGSNLVVQNGPPKSKTPPVNPGTPNNNPNNNNNPPPPPPNNGGPTPPAFQGFLPLIAGTTVLNNTSTVVPDPTVTAYNSATGGVLTSQGLIYHGQLVDGPFAYFAFGSSGKIDPNLQRFLNTSNGFGSFKFDSLLINGTPQFNVTDITDALFAANGNIELSSSAAFGPNAGGPDGGYYCGAALNLYTSGLTGLVLYSQNGSITVAQDFTVSGAGQDLALSAQSLGSDVSIQGNISLESGILLLGAGRDLIISGQVTADDITATAHRRVVVDGGQVRATNGNLSISAVKRVLITNSAQLVQLADLSSKGLLRLQSKSEDVVIEKNSCVRADNIEIQSFGGNVSIIDSTVTANSAMVARTLSPNGVLTIGGSTISAGKLIQLYAEGSNGTVLFTDNTTLQGYGEGSHPTVQIAGKTVEVVEGKTVNVHGSGRVMIYTDNPLFNTEGYGSFIRGEGSAGTVKPFNGRPKFNGPDTFGPSPNGGANPFGRPLKTPGAPG